MKNSMPLSRWASALVIAGALVLAGSALDQAVAQTPKHGGTLTIGNLGALPTLDCHALGLGSQMVELAPAYSSLLRFDQDSYPNVIGDLAESWTLSPDRLTYTFKLRPKVEFHDGSPFTSADVKASYDRIRNPPSGVTSLRQSLFAGIAQIDTPDPLTLVIKLAKPDPTMLINFANPLNCIYSAKMLAQDPTWPASHVLGTGPYKFADYVPGASISFTRFDHYFVPGLPYLDGIKVVFLIGTAYVNAIASGQVDAALNQVSPTMRETVKAARGDQTVFQETGSNITNFADVNTTKAPLNDARVRRALNWALDRRTGEAMMRRLTANQGYGVLFTGGVSLDMTDEEKNKLPGFGPDIVANRAEAKRLLAAAGVKDLHLTLLSRNIGEPYTSLGVFLTDQLRQIGVTVDQRVAESAPYFSSLAGLNFDLAIDTNATTTSDPNEVLTKYLPTSPSNFTGSKDATLQDLFDQQAFETDQTKRRALVNQFEQRMMDQSYILPLFLSVNRAAIPANLKGWKILPSFILNTDMRQVWLDK